MQRVGGQPYLALNADKPWSARVWPDNYVRFELRPGERQALDSATVDRSEFVARNEQPFDTDVWLSFAQRISPGAITDQWSVLGQFWALEDPGEDARSPVFAQQLYADDEFVITTRSDPAPISPSNPSGVKRYSSYSFVRGVWHNFVYRVRFSRTGTGELQGWMDGTEFLPTLSIPIGFNDVRGPFWKFGCYRATGTSTTAVIEYANTEVGTSSLAGRVTFPLPLPPSAP